MRSLSTYMQSRGLSSAKSQLQSFAEPFKASRSHRADSPINVVETQPSNTGLVPASQTSPAKNGYSEPQKPAIKSVCRSVVGNIALLKSHRTLLSRLEEYCEMVIFRDLGPIEGAPDLILSPLACIVITTVQAAQQRSLPGSRPGTIQSCPLHERLHRLSLTYQQIFVLTVTPSTACIDSGTESSSALASFYAFAARYSPGCEISLVMIPPMSYSDRNIRADNARVSGLHHYLLERIVLLMHDHGYGRDKNGYKVGDPAKLSQEETQGEWWLKHAGLNPFAAQATIGLLENTHHNGMTGLRALISISQNERVKLLGDIIGMRAVDLLDARIDCQAQG